MSLVNVVKIAGVTVAAGVAGAAIGWGSFKLYMKLSGKDESNKETTRGYIRRVIVDIKGLVKDHKLVLSPNMLNTITNAEAVLADPKTTYVQLGQQLKALNDLFAALVDVYVKATTGATI